ncbi:MAG TPA: hypothetical protein DCE11_03085 [Ruminiclostridium sp.]|nr:hypothetical protein [Ruminiclostridium sp.]
MENSLKAIIIGAGVVITMIVVSIGFLLMRSGQSTAQNAINRLDQISSEMSESQYTMYDGMEIRGSEVVNVLRKYKDEYIGIYVKTKKSTNGVWYVYDVTLSGNEAEIGSPSTKSISDTMDETKDEYINPNGVFIGSIARDENGRIAALMFKQQ